VEYLHYVLIILALVALCLYVVRIPGELRLARKPDELAARAREHRRLENQQAVAEQPLPPKYNRIIQRELKHVPTPWGWPGSDVRQGKLRDAHQGNGSSPARQSWIDQLLSEKRTVDDRAYQLRKEASLRALLEDRFGRPAKPGEMDYRKVKPPLLRDPNRPYDQEDNFPGGRTEQIVTKLERQPAGPAPALHRLATRKAGGLKDVRKPWGW
jgi:hypothetical protein